MGREVIFRTTIPWGELEAWATKKSLTAFPVKENNGYRIDLFINEKFVKSGTKIYDTWQEASAYTLDKLYNKLGE